MMANRGIEYRSKKSRYVKAVLFIICFHLSIYILHETIFKKTNKNRVDEKLKLQFSGVIVEKISTYKYREPTKLKIKCKKQVIFVVPKESVMEKINIGDSIKKFKYENFVFIKSKGDSVFTKEKFIRIPQE